MAAFIRNGLSTAGNLYIRGVSKLVGGTGNGLLRFDFPSGHPISATGNYLKTKGELVANSGAEVRQFVKVVKDQDFAIQDIPFTGLVKLGCVFITGQALGFVYFSSFNQDAPSAHVHH